VGNPLGGLFMKQLEASAGRPGGNNNSNNLLLPPPSSSSSAASAKYQEMGSTTLPPLGESISSKTLQERKNTFNKSVSRSAPKPSPKQAQFNNILGMIREARSGKGASMEDVLQTWKSVSQF
jgi:hypothetical protein